METKEVPTRWTMDDLLAAVEKLPNQALVEGSRRVQALQTEREPLVVETADEQTLLQILADQRLPEIDQKRLAWLREKSDDETLTAEEQAELLQHVERVEQLNLTRIEALIELAQRHGVTLRAIIQQLEIESNDA